MFKRLMTASTVGLILLLGGCPQGAPLDQGDQQPTGDGALSPTDEVGLAIRDALNAGRGTGNVLATASKLAQAIAALQRDDPASVADRLHEIVREQVETAEDAAALQAFYEDLAGEVIWLREPASSATAKRLGSQQPNGNSRRVVALYVNGVFTSLEDASLDTATLDDYLADDPRGDFISGVGLHWNTSSADPAVPMSKRC